MVLNVHIYEDSTSQVLKIYSKLCANGSLDCMRKHNNEKKNDFPYDCTNIYKYLAHIEKSMFSCEHHGYF